MPITYQLLPFASSGAVKDLTCSLEIQAEHVFVEFCLTATLSDIIWPEHSASSPHREWDLWQHTCFECFIADTNKPAYYEINLSPSGNWNAYHFTDYRQGMEETSDIICNEIKLEQANKNETRLWASLNLNRLNSNRPGLWTSLDINLTGVVEDAQGNLNYFALKHADTGPDFHLRDTFRTYTT